MQNVTKRVALAFAAVGVLAASCGSDDAGTAETPASSEASTASGTITIYSGRSEDLVKPILDQFTEATGINVEFRGGSSGELAAQLLTEGDASPADLFFSQDAGALGAVEKAGLFATLPENLLAIVPDAYRSDGGSWIGTSGRVRVIVYNPDLAPDPPTSIDKLLEPQWKGQIGFAPTNASWQSFVTGLRVLRGDDAARLWLEAFAAQDPVPYEGNGAVRDAVNGGDVALGLVNHYYVYEKLAAEGADAVVVENQFLAPGDPGGLVNVAGVGILSTSHNVDAAEALVEYLLSEAGQTYFAEETYEYPLRAGIPTAEGLPTLESLDPPAIDLADLDTIEETQELLSDVGLLTL